MSILANFIGGGCSADFDLRGGFIIYAVLVLYSFYILAKVCDGHLTRALEFIVERLQLSEDVAGATFLAMASSAPELFCAILTTFIMVGPSGIGNIVGSALFNLLVIIGVLPLFTQGKDLSIWWYPTLRDSGFYGISIISLWITIADGVVVWYEAFIMLVIYAIYVAWMAKNEQIIAYFKLKRPGEETEAKAAKKTEAKPEPLGPPMYPAPNNAPTGVVVGAASMGNVKLSDNTSDCSTCASSTTGRPPLPPPSYPPPDLERGPRMAGSALGGRSLGDKSPKSRAGNGMLTVIQSSGNLRGFLSFGLDEFHTARSTSLTNILGDAEEASGPKPCPTEPTMWLVDLVTPTTEDKVVGIFASVITVIGLYTYIMVDAGERLGCIMHIPKVVMGLVILAAGTSVPDCISSIAVAREGMGDMAAANAVGSNTFNLLVGLPLPWLVSCMMGNEVFVPADQLTENLIILLVCLIAYLLILHFGGWKLNKKMGGLMLLAYIFSICYTLYRAFSYYGHKE